MIKRQARQCAAQTSADPPAVKRKGRNFLLCRNEADHHKCSDIWLITLSDLLMLLVIFFVVLFSMEMQKRTSTASAHAKEKETALQKKEIAARPESSPAAIPAAVEKDLVAIMNSEKGGPEPTVKRADNHITLTFPEKIIFDPGQAELKPTAQRTLDKVAFFIRERAYLNVEVQGHTDNQPINTVRYPSNWELSADRATQVAKALIGMGVNPLQLSVKGFGEHRSLYPNDSDGNRLKNRRVEIQFSIPPTQLIEEKFTHCPERNSPLQSASIGR